MKHTYGILLLTSLAFLSIVLGGWTEGPDQQFITVTGTVTDADLGDPLPGVNVTVKGTNRGCFTDLDGNYQIEAAPSDILKIAFVGYETQEVTVGNRSVIDVALSSSAMELEEVVVIESRDVVQRFNLSGAVSGVQRNGIFRRRNQSTPAPSYDMDQPVRQLDREEYASINERGFVKPQDEALSTFSIDVDVASYANMRRFINQGQKPPEDAIRIEEMINYFNYSYPQPDDEHPFSITTEVGPAPWAPDHYLLHVGLQGKIIPAEDLPPSNLVFLIDVSGSMSSANKLGLVKRSMEMLTDQLRKEDRVAIVVYAGAAGVVLDSTPGNQPEKIKRALRRLEAGGSTAGGAGIEMAYKIALENFQEGGNNRVIMCSDGDFNVGTSSSGGLERLIERKREQGVFLTVLGYGMGNYQDSKMEILADKGNGNYAYIDNAQEAQKVLVSEFGGTLFTIAKDVKLQLEFNPRYVQGYRLIGYENRMLEAEDFNDDKKDAGELGSGHTVTALYEIIPTGINSSHLGSVDALRYQASTSTDLPAGADNEWATVKFRYKAPRGTTSQLIVHPIAKEETRGASNNFSWSAAVAQYGMLLRDSDYKGNASYDAVIALARGSRGNDEEGYRAEFIRLVKASRLLGEAD
ncbi:MAG: von Willebrand factor type A domain-containing protein [Bacteroidota bacterium]